MYTTSLLTRRVSIPVTSIDAKIKSTLTSLLSKELDGRCTVEGYIKPTGRLSSIKVQQFSCGRLVHESADITVAFECEIALPLVGEVLECTVQHKTHAGLKCGMGENSPYVIFVARDHHHTMGRFAGIQEGDSINVTVVGQRFDVNDRFISVIGTLVDAYSGPDDDALFSGKIEYSDATVDDIRKNQTKTYILLKAPKAARTNVIVLRTQYTDATLKENKLQIDDDIKRMQECKVLVFPTTGLTDALNDAAPKTYDYLMQKLSALGMTTEREEQSASEDDEELSESESEHEEI